MLDEDPTARLLLGRVTHHHELARPNFTLRFSGLCPHPCFGLARTGCGNCFRVGLTLECFDHYTLCDFELICIFVSHWLCHTLSYHDRVTLFQSKSFGFRSLQWFKSIRKQIDVVGFSTKFLVFSKLVPNVGPTPAAELDHLDSQWFDSNNEHHSKTLQMQAFSMIYIFLTQHRIFNFVPWHWISQILNNFNRLGPVYSLSWPRTKTTHWKLDKPYGFIKLFRSSLWNLGSAHRCKDLHRFHVNSCLYVLVFLFSNQPIYVFVLLLLNDCDVF